MHCRRVSLEHKVTWKGQQAAREALAPRDPQAVHLQPRSLWTWKAHEAQARLQALCLPHRPAGGPGTRAQALLRSACAEPQLRAAALGLGWNQHAGVRGGVLEPGLEQAEDAAGRLQAQASGCAGLPKQCWEGCGPAAGGGWLPFGARACGAASAWHCE